MPHQRLVSGFVLALAIACASSASTAAIGDQNRAQTEADKQKPPDKPKGNLDRLELQKLEEVLANQEQLLRRLETLGGTTLPNELHGVQKVLVDAIADLEFAVLDAIGGPGVAMHVPGSAAAPAPSICSMTFRTTAIQVRATASAAS